MQEKKQFILLSRTKNSLSPSIFSDLIDDNRIIFLPEWSHEPENSFLKLLKRIHFSYKINKIIALPLKNLWRYTLDDITWKKETDYYLIASEFYPIDVNYLRKLRKRHHIKYVLYLLDAWENSASKNNREYDEKLGFDMIFTIDNDDSKKYNFIYSDSHYSMLADKQPETIKYDIYFIGVNKGRYQKLLNIYDVLKSGGGGNYVLSDSRCSGCGKNVSG